MEIINVCGCDANITLYDPVDNSVSPETTSLLKNSPTLLKPLSGPSGVAGMKIERNGSIVWDGMVPYGMKYTFTNSNELLSDADGWSVPNLEGKASCLTNTKTESYDSLTNATSLNTYLIIGIIFAVIFGILLFFFTLKNNKMKK